MWLKLHKGKLSRETRFSAGYDLFVSSPERILIPPGERKIVPTGVFTQFEPGYMAYLCDKSGYAAKLGLTLLGRLIDADYPKEWGAIVLNTGKEQIVLNPGVKVCQAVFLKFPELEVELGPGAEFIESEEERKDGFGSTGTT